MSEDFELPDNRHLAIRVMAGPADSNAEGDIFGGWIMSQVDIAGSIIARRRAQGRIVTVAVNVKAFAERYRRHQEIVHLTEADLTYVAVDKQRRPRPLPK